MILGLLVGGAALLVGGKIVVDAVNEMSPEEIQDLANGIKNVVNEINEAADELNELSDINKAIDECEKELDEIIKM